MDTDIKNFTINSLSGLLTAIVVIYLDKNGLTSLAYVVFGLYMLFLISVAIKFHKSHKTTQPINNQIKDKADEKENTDIKQSFEEQLTYEILFHILQIKGMSQRATPRILASTLDYKPSLILSHLHDLHNDQYVTFYSSETDGKPPDLDTDFFVSPKAFEIIKICKATQQIHPADPD